MEPLPHAVEPPLSPGTACVACGYDLRGLPGSGTCPECGTPISFSVRGDFYRFGEPERIGRMAVGAIVVMVTLIAALPLWFFLSFLDGFGAGAARAGTVSAVGTAAWVLVHAGGWWMMSEAEPGRRVIEADGAAPGRAADRPRVWLRDALLIFVAVSVGAIILGLWRASGAGLGLGNMTSKRVMAALWLATIVAGVGVLLTGLRHVMSMARRLPPGGLGIRAEFLFLLVATIAAMMALSALLSGAMYGLGLPDAVGMLSGVCGCMSVPLWLIALVGVMTTMNTLASALRREQVLAIEMRRERQHGSLP